MYDKGLDRIEKVSNLVSTDLINEIHSYHGNSFDPKELMLRMALNMTAVYMVGRKYERNEPVFQHLLNFEERLVHAFSAGKSGFIYDLFPWTKYLGNGTEAHILSLR